MYCVGMGRDKSHNESSGLRNSPNRVLAIFVGVIIIAVIIVTVFSATKSAVTLDRGTPAGTVQAYLKAVLEGKNVEAAKFLAPESECSVTDLDRTYVIDTARVDLVDATIDGKDAQVRVKVEIPSGGPFEDFRTEDHTFRLIRSDGNWLLTGIPWPLYNCGVLKK